MSLSESVNRSDIVAILAAAEAEASPVEPITASRSLSLEEAYEVQQQLIERKLGRGERWIGLKAGLTSRAKQQMVNIDEPILGQILSSNLEAGDSLNVGSLIQPRVEPEIAFLLKKELTGQESAEEEVLQAIDSVVLALEVLDSRFHNYSFKIQDVVADNASTARIFLSKQRFRAERQKLGKIQVEMFVNGDLRESGSSDAVLGHPLASALWLAQKWRKLGRTVPPGSLLLTGGITTAVPISRSDQIKAVFVGLGEMQFRCQ